MHCHECGVEVPETARRCYVFDHPFCDTCWDRLLPPDPVDYHRLHDRALSIQESRSSELREEEDLYEWSY